MPMCFEGFKPARYSRTLNFSLKRALRRGEPRIGVAGGSASVGGGCYEEPEKMWFNHVQREVSRKLRDVGLQRDGDDAEHCPRCDGS